MKKPKENDDWTRREVGRLAMRREGKWWKAYYALPNTMADAILLGMIAFRFVEGQDDRTEAFMDVMRESVADILEEAYGTRPSWSKPRPAPESERSGNA